MRRKHRCLPARPRRGQCHDRHWREPPAAIRGPAGVGMSEAVRSQCLEPFFTTKGERGTGLGLAMVYGMVKRHSSELEIDSEPGAGTTMRLIFPVAAGARISAPQE